MRAPAPAPAPRTATTRGRQCYQHFNNTASAEAFLYRDGKGTDAKLFGRRVAGFRTMTYAFIVDEETGDEVVVGKMAQLDKWGHDFEIAVSGGLDPWIVCSVLTSCRPGSGGGAGAGGWSGAGGAY